MVTRKDRKLIQDKVISIMGRVENAVKDEVGVAGEATSSSLDDLRRQYETVNIKIKKKGTDGQMALFLPLEGQSPSYLQDLGLDALCMEQGGGGQYEVWIQAPGQAYKKYWGGAVMGQSYDIPKAKREALNPFMGLPGAAPFQLPSGNYHIPEVVGQSNSLLAKQSEQSADRMTSMMMMMQQQQQSSATMQMQMMQQAAQQQMQMMAAMFSREDKGSSDETRRLEMELQKMREDRERERREEERRRYEDQRREDERRWQEMQRQVAEQKNSQLLDLAKLGNRGDKDMAGILATVFGSNQQLMQSANQQYIALMEKMMDKPSETEKIGELTNVMLNSQLGQMNLMTQALQSGLLGGNEPQHPILEAVKEGIRALAQMRGMGLPGPQQPAGYYEEDYPQQAHAQVMPQPQPQPQQPQLPPGQQPSGSMGGLPQEQGQEQELIEIPPEARLNKDDLERLEKDRAIVPVISTILRGDDLTDVPLRLYIHATQGGSPLARLWLEYPSEVTWQVCQHFDVPMQRAEQVLEVFAAFIDFVSPKEEGGQGHSVEEWSSKSYNPPAPRKAEQRQVRTADINRNSLSAPEPELGVSRGGPPPGVEYEEYDPSKPPPGHSIEDAEKESQEAARRALASVQPQVDPK